MKTIFTEQQLDYIKDNYEKKSYKEIADFLGFTERQIRGKVNNMGLRKLREINDTYFRVIDTPLKAYFLGFIYADGWIINKKETRNYELGIELQSCDKYLLELLNKELGGKNVIKHSNPTQVKINNVLANRGHMDCLRIYSKNIVIDLEKNGILCNKTKSNVYPIVEGKLFFDFLRGYIDGDGCFYMNKGHINMHITCSSEAPLEYIHNTLLVYDINTYLYKEKERKYRLVCCDENSIRKLVNHLYYKGDLFYLQRKYNKVKSLIGSIA